MSCYTQRQCAHLWSARTRTFQCSSIANRMLCVLSQPEVLITKLSLEQTFISSLKNNEYIFWIFRLNLQMAMVTIKNILVWNPRCLPSWPSLECTKRSMKWKTTDIFLRMNYKRANVLKNEWWLFCYEYFYVKILKRLLKYMINTIPFNIIYHFSQKIQK